MNTNLGQKGAHYEEQMPLIPITQKDPKGFRSSCARNGYEDCICIPYYITVLLIISNESFRIFPDLIHNWMLHHLTSMNALPPIS